MELYDDIDAHLNSEAGDINGWVFAQILSGVVLRTRIFYVADIGTNISR